MSISVEIQSAGIILKVEGGGFSQQLEVGALEKGKEYNITTLKIFPSLKKFASTATSFTADTEFSPKQKICQRYRLQKMTQS